MAVLNILISVFVFSLWALVAALGIEKINYWEFIFWIELFSWITSVALLKLATFGRRDIRIKKLSELRMAEVVEFSLSGLTLVLAQACLLASFHYISKAGAMIVYEVWPIMAMFVTPLIVAKAWERMKWQDLLYSLLALAGVALILMPECHEPFFATMDGMAARYSTLLLPLLGGIFNAITSVMNVRLSHATQIKGHPVITVLAAQAKYGLFGLAFATLGLLWNCATHGAPSEYTPMNITGMLFISVVIYTVGRLTYAVGLLHSKNPNITVLWYLTPILTVLWLWLAGQSGITAAIVLGSCFIITANLLMSVKADDRKAYPATILTLLGVGNYCHYIHGLSMAEYYQAISVPLVFYAIIVAFLMDRLIRRDTYEEGLVIGILNHIETHGGPKALKKHHALVEEVAGIVRTTSATELDKKYRTLRNAGHAALAGATEKLDALAVSRIQGATFGEMMVLLLVGLLTVMTTIVFRPVDFVADCFAVVLSGALVFIFFTVLDLIALRSKFFLEIDAEGHYGLSKETLGSSRGEIAISAVMILIVIAAMVGVMWFQQHT